MGVSTRGLRPIVFVSPSQANLQVPWELAGMAQASIRSTVGGQVSDPQTVNLAAVALGIFTINQQGTGQGAILISSTALLAAPENILGGRPVMKGEFISIYCTGLGPVSNQPATGSGAKTRPLSRTPTIPIVTIGGMFATVTYFRIGPWIRRFVPGKCPGTDGRTVRRGGRGWIDHRRHCVKHCHYRGAVATIVHASQWTINRKFDYRSQARQH